MASYTCPVCFDVMAEPAAQVAGVAVCPACGASFVVSTDGSTRRATAVDTTALSEAERQTLRTSRRRTR